MLYTIRWTHRFGKITSGSIVMVTRNPLVDILHMNYLCNQIGHKKHSYRFIYKIELPDRWNYPNHFYDYFVSYHEEGI